MNSSLIFCDNMKNITDINFEIIKQIRDEVFSFIDEFEDDDFIFAKDFTIFRLIKDNSVIYYYDNDEDDDDNLTNFKFKTDDNLLYNKKSNIPVCVISICSVIIQSNSLYKTVFMKMKIFKKHKVFLCINIKDG